MAVLGIVLLRTEQSRVGRLSPRPRAGDGASQARRKSLLLRTRWSHGHTSDPLPQLWKRGETKVQRERSRGRGLWPLISPHVCGPALCPVLSISCPAAHHRAAYIRGSNTNQFLPKSQVLWDHWALTSSPWWPVLVPHHVAGL